MYYMIRKTIRACFILLFLIGFCAFWFVMLQFPVILIFVLICVSIGITLGIFEAVREIRRNKEEEEERELQEMIRREHDKAHG